MALDRRRVPRLYEFLARNRTWNQAFQAAEYRRALAHCSSASERLSALLHSTAITQSRPRIGALSAFWHRMGDFKSRGVPSLDEFTLHLQGARDTRTVKPGPWSCLFEALAGQPGWGPKTSALFVKSAIEVHRGPKRLHFLCNPTIAAAPLEGDTVRLPVDSVITFVFRCLGLNNADFATVNAALAEDYDAESMLVWDDLWYWGFFTQVTSASAADGARTLAWNSDKFWCQPAAPKAQEAVVRELAEEFIAICRGA